MTEKQEKPYDFDIKKSIENLGITVLPHDQYLKEIQTEDAVLACMPTPTPGFPDNLQGKCSDCGTDIYYRPYNSKVTTKLCIKCITRRIEKEARRQK